ncbi:unnamed protein product, partial [Urochloa humidicola]
SPTPPATDEARAGRRRHPPLPTARSPAPATAEVPRLQPASRPAPSAEDVPHYRPPQSSAPAADEVLRRRQWKSHQLAKVKADLMVLGFR